MDNSIDLFTAPSSSPDSACHDITQPMTRKHRKPPTRSCELGAGDNRTRPRRINIYIGRLFWKRRGEWNFRNAGIKFTATNRSCVSHLRKSRDLCHCHLHKLLFANFNQCLVLWFCYLLYEFDIVSCENAHKISIWMHRGKTRHHLKKIREYFISVEKYTLNS